MGKITGFKEYNRELPVRRPVEERIKDFKEIYQPFAGKKLKKQAARCMDCGVPTCHAGCPLANLIPDWNDFVYRDRWRDALDQLLLTNNFPEFTGRLCPAPCEEACVLAINEPAVTIEQIEKEIIEHAFEQGWINPEPGLCPAIEPRRSHGNGIRKGRTNRRSFEIRHPGFQTRKVGAGPAPGPYAAGRYQF